jgi:hypothetical protein
MRTKTATVPLIATLVALFFWSAALAADQRSDLEALARTAFADDSILAVEAASSLRQMGPAGMEAMLAQGASGEALDRVCGVRDCADIRLFWYTDLEAAKAAARASGKPILSLRLMGRLDEEFSCANSRFFRTVFYKNHDINELLRKRFVLHWRSVRPVPKVTIDFGDGSRLERTLTGNSIHYVLDSRGRLIEALPGLYGPAEFQNALQKAALEALYAERLDDSRFASWMSGRAKDQLMRRAEALPRERAFAADPGMILQPEDALWNPAMADQLASSKSAVEGRVLQAVGNRRPARAIPSDPEPAPPSMPPALANLTDDDLRALGDFRRPYVHLDAESRAFLLRKQGVTDAQQGDRLVDSFEQTIARDEVIDDYRLRPAILLKLSDPEVVKSFDLEAFNLWLYENVFRTPLTDPWLGLAPDDVYGALPASARTEAPRRQGG